MKRLFFSALVLLVALIVVLLFNTLRLTSQQSTLTDHLVLSFDKAVLERLSGAIRIPTVSGQFAPQDFQAFLRQHYPRVFESLSVRMINQGGILMHWRAKAGSSAGPVLLLAHYDVVPAQEDGWKQAPFSGFNDGTYIWGRGSLDNKSALLAMLEAVTVLLRQGYTPSRDIYLAFGHDEEINGHDGAGKMATYFREQGLEFEFILDEGLLITDGILSFVDQPVALIGIAEKGFMNVELMLEGDGGHASMPGRQTLVGRMAEALACLESEPMPARLITPTIQMLRTLAPESDLSSRIVFSNLWLFRPIVLRKFLQQPATHAAVSSTFAPTRLFAGSTINVLPNQVRADINIRLLPGDASADVLAHIKRVIGDPDIKIRPSDVVEASAISATTSAGYEQVAGAIQQTFPNTLVAPGLVIPATDSRHYADLSRTVLRFIPVKVTNTDLARLHGRNERIDIENYHAMIRFYLHLLGGGTVQTQTRI